MKKLKIGKDILGTGIAFILLGVYLILSSLGLIRINWTLVFSAFIALIGLVIIILCIFKSLKH